MLLKYCSYLFFALGLVLVSSTSCDDVDLSGDLRGQVEGFWERTAGGRTSYLLVSQTEVNFYNYKKADECFTIDQFEVVSVDELGFYTIRKEGEEEFKTLALSRNDDRLDVRELENTQDNLKSYFLSAADQSVVDPECTSIEDVYGSWEMDYEGGKTIVEISADSIKVADYVSMLDCYFISKLEVVSVQGSVFTLTDNDPMSSAGTQRIILSIEDGMLKVERKEQGEDIIEYFSPSSSSIADIDQACTPEDFNIEGQWQLQTEASDTAPLIYLVIEPGHFVFYYYKGDPDQPTAEDCYDVKSLNIISTDEQYFTLSDPLTNETLEVAVHFDFENGFLIMDDGDLVQTFFSVQIEEGVLDDVCTVTE